METGWVFIAVILGLLIFGGVYNSIVARLEEKGHDRGYTAYLVVGGTLVTVKTLVATMIGRVALQLSINLESIKAVEKIISESAE